MQADQSTVVPLADRLAWSPEEFGNVSGQGRTLIYEHIRAGTLATKKSGRRTLILREDGIAFLRSLPAGGRAA